jgi:hypothetical protein
MYCRLRKFKFTYITPMYYVVSKLLKLLLLLLLTQHERIDVFGISCSTMIISYRPECPFLAFLCHIMWTLESSLFIATPICGFSTFVRQQCDECRF